MRKLYENFHIFQFQKKRIVSAEAIRGNTASKTENTFLSMLTAYNIQVISKIQKNSDVHKGRKAHKILKKVFAFVEEKWLLELCLPT